MFEGRTLLIATKHGKEQVIKPVLERELGTRCIVPSGLDTDLFGTFSGEVERSEDPVTTARNKCLMAMEAARCDLAIATEGSFAPHPSNPYQYANDEVVLFLDTSNELEIFVRVLSTATNFNAAEISTKDALKTFAYKAGFPSSGLMIRRAKDDLSGMIKGIRDWDILSAQFGMLVGKYGSAYVETDMRAMFNPGRMRVIEQATQKLTDKIKSCCPQCNTPGLGITAIKEGLPCSRCGKPTRSIKSHLYECRRCDFVKEICFPDEQVTEDPMYCDFCNP